MLAPLPHNSTQVASAMLTRITSIGSPVVASRLAQFGWLRGLGAGILRALPTPGDLAAAVERVLRAPLLRAEPSAR